MGRLRRIAVPFRWNAISMVFTQGTSSAVNLTSFLSNPEGRTITYSVVGTLPTGVTLSGSTVSYNGSGAVSSASVQFRAVSGSFTADSSSTTVIIQAAPVGNTAPTWRANTPSTFGTFTTAGGTFDLSQWSFDAEGDPIRYYRTGGAEDTAPGTVTVNETTGFVTIPAGLPVGNYSVTVEVAAANDPDAEWIEHSTAQGVIWAHDFRDASEVTAFVDTGQNTRFNGMWKNPERVATGLGNSYALRCRAYGTTLVDPLPGAAEGAVAGQTDTVRVANVNEFAALWPPSPNANARASLVVGTSSNGEYVKLVGVDTTAGTISVQRSYDDDSNSFGGSPKTLPAGTRIGTVSSTWMRPFAAFPAGVNGKAAPDIGITQGHATQHRFKRPASSSAGDIAAAPYTTFDPDATRAFSRFVGGWFGHSQHQTEFPTFYATDGGNYTDQPWMGNEFYLRFSMKVPPSRFSQNGSTQSTQAKAFYLHTVSESGASQVFANFPTTNSSAITPPSGATYPYYSVGDWQTNAQTGSNGWGEYLSRDQSNNTNAAAPNYVFYDESHPSGSAFTATWSNLSGETSWCWVPDKWITFLVNYKMGRHNWFRYSYATLTNELPASGSRTDQRTEVIRVTNAAVDERGRTMPLFRFPKPSDTKPSGAWKGVTWGNVGQAWGQYPVWIGSWNNGTEIVKVLDVVDVDATTQDLTVIRNWYRDDTGLSTPTAAGTRIGFGPKCAKADGANMGYGAGLTHNPEFAQAKYSPHLSPYADWHVTVWAHIEGETGYTKIIDKSDYRFVSGAPDGYGDFIFNRNPPGGVNGFGVQYYPNPYIGAGGAGAPVPTYQDVTRVILSRNFIPCPTA